MNNISQDIHSVNITGEQARYLQEALSAFVAQEHKEQADYHEGGTHWEMYEERMRGARAILLKISQIPHA